MKKRSLYGIFFVILLVTEFYYIEIGGGVARIYHFLAPLVVLSLTGYIPHLFRSSVFLAVAAFLGVNLLAAVLSDAPEAAFTSLLLLGANITIAIATALILISGKMDIDYLKNLILSITIISVLWGLVQAIGFNVSGMVLGLSDSQDIQISAGYGPGFRTEANTFAKYLSFAFLIMLPGIIREKFGNKSLFIIAIFIAGMFLNFTRSSIYGLLVTLLFVFFWYVMRGRGELMTRKFIVLSSLTAISLFVFVGFAGSFNEYTLHKLQYFFDKGEILEGGSSGFRLMSQDVMIDAFLSSDKSILIGNGWGQVRYYYGDELWQAGGGELITALAYGGLFAAGAYIFYLISSFRAAMNMARLSHTHKEKCIFEGVMFVIVYFFVTGQINGSLNAPEYWLLIGISIFLSYRLRLVTTGKFSFGQQCGKFS